MQETDPAVVRAAVAGDVGAFEQIVRLHQQSVWRFLRRLLGDAAAAEDVTQETFLRVHRRLPDYGFRSSFTAWVFQIARNAGIDELRARARRDRLAPILAAAPSVAPSPLPTSGASPPTSASRGPPCPPAGPRRRRRTGRPPRPPCPAS